MLTTKRHFHAVQLFCILAVIASARLAMKVNKSSTGITPIQWVVIVMGLWAIPSGFLVERQIFGKSDKAGRRSRRSTPLSRWRASNLVRVMSATSVALWGLILRENGGPAWLAYLFLAVGGLLVLIWKPRASPEESGRRQSQ
jgi:hypothetical protein